MRFSRKNDRILKSNYRTLLLCSQFKTIKYTSLLDKISEAQKKLLTSPENKEFVDFLLRVYDDDALRSGEQYIINPRPEDLTDFEVPKNRYNIPKKFERQFKTHQARVRKMQQLMETMDEHQELRSILYGDSTSGNISRNVNPTKIAAFLRSKKHTDQFSEFGQKMLDSNAALTLLKYKISALKLAKDTSLLNERFVDNVNKTFSAEDLNLKLNKEIRGRFIPAATKITALALTGFLALHGAMDLMRGDKDVTKGNVDPHFSYTVEDNSGNKDADDYIITTAAEAATLKKPISNSVKIDSYETAAKDLFQKVEEIYNYNTGKDVDLSALKYENINQADTTVFVANYNGQEYRFSSLSEFRTNYFNLQKALEAAGATVSQYKTTISYLTEDGKSIAIVDSQGNPIQSGKVLEYTGSGTEMYNQTWVNQSRKLMKENGISSDGKSEAELIGYYLLNGTPKQDPELSKAVNEVSPLIDLMKSSFYYKDNGEPDTYALQIYKNKSNEIAQKFNNKASRLENPIVADNTPIEEER